MDRKTFQRTLEIVRDELIRPDFPKTPAEINNGFCADFATIVWERLDRHESIGFANDEELADVEYSHTFLVYDEMYYDAECIEGISDWTQLPVFLR